MTDLQSQLPARQAQERLFRRAGGVPAISRCSLRCLAAQSCANVIIPRGRITVKACINAWPTNSVSGRSFCAVGPAWVIIPSASSTRCMGQSTSRTSGLVGPVMTHARPDQTPDRLYNRQPPSGCGQFQCRRQSLPVPARPRRHSHRP